MKRIVGTGLIWFAFLLMFAVSYKEGDSYCVIFPQNGRDIFGVAQRNILIFREGLVSLIPQVHFEGNARDFGILVPVPAEPKLTTVGANIFTEASFLTQPLVREKDQGCGCDEDNSLAVRPFFDVASAGRGAVVEESSGGVTVIYEQMVGTFQAVVLQASSATDLTEWLAENNYHFDPEDAPLFEDYVAQNWFFVAMKLDTTQAPPFIDQWWNATTSPAKITFAHEGADLTYPLKISAISANEKAEVLIYAIGPDPRRFAGATLEYANEVTADELDAIAEQYPTLYDFINEGDFVTKLRRTFLKSEMQQDIPIFVTEDRREFREIRYRNRGGFGIFALGVVLLCAGFGLRSKR